jgi:hypothetical protein
MTAFADHADGARLYGSGSTVDRMREAAEVTASGHDGARPWVRGAAAVAVRVGADVSAQILEASRSRRFLDCRLDGRRAAVEAEAIRRACLAAGEDGDAFGVRMVNAAVTGVLDLRAAAVGVPLHFVACTFSDALRLDGADLHELVITDGRQGRDTDTSFGSSELPGLLANGVRVRRDLVLSGSVITGAHATSASLTRTSAVWLTEAEIGGRFLAVGTTIRASGDRALQADRTRVAGDVRLVQGFSATGEIRLLAMQLGGSLDLTASSLMPHDGRALDLAEAVVGGSVFILDDPDLRIRPRIRGRVEMGRATIHGQLFVRNADLEAPMVGVGRHDYNSEELDSRAFLLAPRLTVHGGFVVESETVIRGGLLLHGADLKGGFRMDSGILWNASDVAVDLSQANLGSALSMRGALIEGTANLSNARIGGPLDLRDAQFNHPRERRCL